MREQPAQGTGSKSWEEDSRLNPREQPGRFVDGASTADMSDDRALPNLVKGKAKALPFSLDLLPGGRNFAVLRQQLYALAAQLDLGLA